MKEIFEGINISIVGLGGNGQIASTLLSSLGAKIKLIDGDAVEQSNLQRQPLFDTNDIGKNKAETVYNKIRNRSNSGMVSFVSEYVDSSNINALLGNSDLIFEATDSFLTRELINEYAVMKKIPWLMTNSYGYFGEFMLIVPDETACLNCLTGGKKMIPLNCHADQVSPPVPSTVSVMGVSILLKYFQDRSREGNFYFYSTKTMELQKVEVNRVKECKVCSGLIFEKLNNVKFIGRQIF